MKKTLLIATLIALCTGAFAQIGPDLYFIEFTDKNNTPYSLDNPQEYLSQKAIDRRQAQNIAIDSLDLPVNPSYIAALQELGLEIVNPTKWLNGTTVRTNDYNLVLQARNLPFVKSTPRFEIDTVETAKKVGKAMMVTENRPSTNIIAPKYTDSEYGLSYNQIALHNGHLLHAEGFKGEGMLIAVTDGGFTNADQMRSLEYLRNSGRIVATRDFAYNGSTVYGHHVHGSMVLSIMAGYLPGEYIGCAPEADYILITSECDDYEEIIEEFNWVSAIEYADSMGADLANVSLGYVDFDSERYNHSRNDMDGHTNPSSIAATIAASRGMMIVVAAGNSGQYENGHVWIGAPSDAYDIVTVGAIDVNQNSAPFSSYGFVEENRIKPDIASVGWNTYVDYVNDSIDVGSGTSFATPLSTGLIACFWQKFRDKTSTEIREALFAAARPTVPTWDEDITLTTGTPNIHTGRGIVDFEMASNLLSEITEAHAPFGIELYPNPTSDIVTINLNSDKKAQLSIFSSDGRLLDYKKNISHEAKYNFAKYPAGKYIVSLSIDNKVVFSQTVIKQ
ncbi:MAG: S8 family peptidase, partial [Bacteroidales bacterium]|nr:S8 family peptidase [Bacteroidales bacterium]